MALKRKEVEDLISRLALNIYYSKKLTNLLTEADKPKDIDADVLDNYLDSLEEIDIKNIWDNLSKGGKKKRNKGGNI